MGHIRVPSATLTESPYIFRSVFHVKPHEKLIKSSNLEEALTLAPAPPGFELLFFTRGALAQAGHGGFYERQPSELMTANKDSKTHFRHLSRETTKR
ncbi:hypothetical protein AVEN_99714-1 [Araneus ventricosus]|uniref:Uncharacterized protein n=1 Tax=Araneus ventricosus TaxID=182803 RepID=A0A4Y2X963_ARAVE|nr:hypothetical protein AVEN_99714-1 [Araneus ventricosus]